MELILYISQKNNYRSKLFNEKLQIGYEDHKYSILESMIVLCMIRSVVIPVLKVWLNTI